MVFPSLMFQTDPGLVSQFSGFVILAFSFLLHRAKRWVLIGLILISTLLIVQSKANAAVAYPSGMINTPPWFLNPYNNILNYYGNPWGQMNPVYFYPTISPFMMQNQPFFNPYVPSPYGPAFNCPTCNFQNMQPIGPNHPFS